MWQFTIVAGVLLAPFFSVKIKDRMIKQKIPVISLLISLVILIGIILIQIPNTNSLSMSAVFLGILPVIVAAFAYPLGNRKMMEHLNGKLDTFQRVLGMTIASLPAWIILVVFALFYGWTSFYESSCSIINSSS